MHNSLPYTQQQFTAKCIHISMRSNILEIHDNIFKTIFDELSIGAYLNINKSTFASLGSYYYAESYGAEGLMENVFNELYTAIISDDINPAPAPKVEEPSSEYITTQNAYNNEQTPAERLRNTITPFTTLVQLYQHRTQQPFADGNPMGKIFDDNAKICNEILPKIQFYLADIERFYENKNQPGLTYSDGHR